MSNISKKRLPILTIAILYFFIYCPILKPGISIGGTILIGFSFVYAIANFSLVFSYIKLYKGELLLSIFITLYLLLTCIVAGEEITIVKELFLWIVVSTLVPVFLVRVFLVRYKDIAFWDLILEVGFIASILSCIALFSPSFNGVLRAIQVDIDTSGDMLEEQLGFRCYGFASYLTSRYGFVQGLFASLCLLRLDKGHKRYIFYFLTFFLSIIINARTGLFPIGLTLLFILFKNIVRIKLLKLLKICLAGFLGILVIIRIFNMFPDLHDFFMDFVDQLGLIFIEGEAEDSSYAKMLFFPESIAGFIFGEGHRASGVLNSSDIGYVNQVFYGGIIFAGSLLVYELMVFRKIVTWSKEWVLPTIFLLSMLIFNYKGAWFCDNLSAIVRLWILYFYVLAHNQINQKTSIKIG